MSIEKGRAYFRQFGMEDRVREFDVSSATVELAALALGVEGARIAKTLSFKKDDSCILILAAGDARIDNHKFKDKFHMKAKMLAPEEVLSIVGHPVGGVCPFGINDGIDVYLMVSTFILTKASSALKPCSRRSEAQTAQLSLILMSCINTQMPSSGSMSVSSPNSK